jgi:hypothetical protein
LAALEQMVEDLLHDAGKIGFTIEDVAAVLETIRRANRHSGEKEV